MSVWSALAPLLGLLAAGGAIVGALAFRASRRPPKRRDLPEDPLADLFRDQPPR